jgi:hypothetical protein
VIAGFTLAGAFSAVPLVVCGCLKIGYELALLRMFRHTKRRRKFDVWVVSRRKCVV